MKRATVLVTAAAALAAPVYFASAQSTPTPAPLPKFKAEKCYGVAKAGSNDCETMNSSCAGTARRDRQPDAWVYVPEGLCGKLSGGVAKAKKG
ncbi:MAG: DUF2282 domain-containing protein [Gammaproteobacteria bacterium]|nr:DUF2282 domain-containing protein [Gammaproteobacteria bacterium]